MKLEYALYDISLSDVELKETISKAIKYNLDIISVLPPYIKGIKNYIPDNIVLSTPIDYPLGISDLKTRLTSIESCIKNGAKILDIVAPPHLLCNRKYDKFREDIKHISDFCATYPGIQIRYILEYRIFTYELLYKVAQILSGYGVKTILPSTGYMLDDIFDNILATALIKKKVRDINIVCNGNIWTQQHAQNIKKLDLYGVRLNSINGLDLFSKNMPK